MWRKTVRLLWYLAFVYVAVLGWREHSLSWVIAPLFSMGCLFIAQAYLTRHYPDFAPKVSAALVALMLVYSVVFTIWPKVVNDFPWTRDALDRAKTHLDIERALTLDPGHAKAQEVLIAYLRDSSDAEAQDIKRDLDKLVLRRKEGAFGPDDQKQESQVLQRYRSLAERTDALRRLITEPAGVRAQTEVSTAPDSLAKTTLEGAPPIARTVAEKNLRIGAAVPRDKANSRIDVLRGDYDSLASRFRAIQTSLGERTKDLSGSPVKPEIVSAIEMARSDLAAANKALSQGDTEIAGQRLDRVERALKYLESL